MVLLVNSVTEPAYSQQAGWGSLLLDGSKVVKLATVPVGDAGCWLLGVDKALGHGGLTQRLEGERLTIVFGHTGE